MCVQAWLLRLQLCRSFLLSEGQLGLAVFAHVHIYMFIYLFYIYLIKKNIPDASSLY